MSHNRWRRSLSYVVGMTYIAYGHTIYSLSSKLSSDDGVVVCSFPSLFLRSVLMFGLLAVTLPLFDLEHS